MKEFQVIRPCFFCQHFTRHCIFLPDKTIQNRIHKEMSHGIDSHFRDTLHKSYIIIQHDFSLTIRNICNNLLFIMRLKCNFLSKQFLQTRIKKKSISLKDFIKVLTKTICHYERKWCLQENSQNFVQSEKPAIREFWLLLAGT